MRRGGVVLIILFVLSLPGWMSTGEWEGMIEYRLEEGPGGPIDRLLAAGSSLSLEPGLILQLDLSLRDEQHSIKNYKTKQERSLSLTFPSTIAEIGLAWEVDHGEHIYPHAGYKSWKADEIGLELKSPADSLSLALELKQRVKAFPDKPVKDLLTGDLSLTIELQLDNLTLSEALEDKHERYPHDKRKDQDARSPPRRGSSSTSRGWTSQSRWRMIQARTSCWEAAERRSTRPGGVNGHRLPGEGADHLPQ